ncbi:MAG: murein biosynthesis integral membrane protein MurJ [Candidatus Zixiibacteriota bacterium]
MQIDNSQETIDKRNIDEDFVVSSAWWVSFGTLISRIMGLFRQVLMASIFGTGMAMDAFRVAYRIPNLLRRVIGEGGLTRVFMPVYAGILEKKGKEAADRFTSSLMIVLFVFLIILAFFLFFAAPIIVPWLADGWKDEPEKITLAIKMLRLFTPYIFLISFYSLFMGYLNSNRRFFLPAIGPAFLNGIWFLGMIFILFKMKNFDNVEKIYAVVIFLLIGATVQFLIQIPMSKKYGIFKKPAIKEDKGNITELGRLLSPTLFSVAVGQINMIVDVKLASRLMEGSVSALSYANMLTTFPIGIISKAIGTASLPSLSSYSAKGDIEGMTSMITYTLRLVLSLMIPIAFLAFIFRIEVIELLFQRGNFSANVSTPLTAFGFMGYIFSIIGYGGSNIMIQGFYAVKDTKIPVIGAAIATVTNVVLNLLFVGPLIHGGLAIASTIAGFAYLAFLIIVFQIKIGGLKFGKLIRRSAAFTVISLVSGVIGWLFIHPVREYLVTSVSLIDKLINFFVPAGISVALIIAMYHFFGFQEYKKLSKPLIRRAKKIFKKSQ